MPGSDGVTDAGGAATPPQVGVVVLNWNGKADTLACLDSLWAASPRAARVAVVDNGSRDDSVPAVRQWARERGIACAELAGTTLLSPERPEWLVLIALGENRGFAGGNNAGLRVLARLPELSHFLLLNNDATVAPDYFTALADALRAAPDAGLLCGTIYEHTDRTKVWYAGGVAIPWRALALHRTERPRGDAPVPTEFVTGCALVVSRRALETIGPLAECYYPVYVEDAEYSARALQAGLPVLYAPGPTVYHKISATNGRMDTSPFTAYLQARHRGFYVRRNLRGAQRLLALGYLVATKPGRALVVVMRGRPRMGWATLSGTVSGLFSPEARRDSAPV